MLKGYLVLCSQNMCKYSQLCGPWILIVFWYLYYLKYGEIGFVVTTSQFNYCIENFLLANFVLQIFELFTKDTQQLVARHSHIKHVSFMNLK